MIAAEPIAGFKLVTRLFRAFVGDDEALVYAVGSTYQLADGDALMLGRKGFHFCRAAVDCMAFVPQHYVGHCRLLRVEVPAGATFLDDGRRIVASQLAIVAEADASLLTGTTTIGFDRTARFVNGLLQSTDDVPSFERRDQAGRALEMEWHHANELHRDQDRPASQEHLGEGFWRHTWATHGLVTRRAIVDPTSAERMVVVLGSDAPVLDHAFNAAVATIRRKARVKRKHARTRQ
jgi:hypothetical protein